MSISAMNWAFQQQGIKSGEKLVLVILSNYAGEEGICYPSIETIMRDSCMGHTAVISNLNSLVKRELVERRSRGVFGGGRRSNVYQLRFEKAIVRKAEFRDESTESGISTKVRNPIDESTESGTEPSDNRKIYKNTSRRKFADEDFKVAMFIFQKIKELNPGHRKPTLDSWANTVRLMVEKDGRSHREICEMYQWVNGDPFWQSNILSPKKLREKWDQLVIRRQSEKSDRCVPGGAWQSESDEADIRRSLDSGTIF